MTRAVLFDLGNTLAAYYHTKEFRPILTIGAVRDELSRRGLCRVSPESALAAAIAENQEAPDYRFTPMTDRFERIFQVTLTNDSSLTATTCERFLAPIVALAVLIGVGERHEDDRPTRKAP
jgi:hypothetical protein